jgi:transcriptional regulator with XRE-family HTH domain
LTAKAPASGISLDYRDTRTVKGMLLRGDRQHDIASYFGVNGARISEIANGSNNYPNAEPLPEADLPPPGPYLSKFALQSVVDTLNEAIEALDLAEAENDIADVKTALILARQTIQNKIDLLQEV